MKSILNAGVAVGLLLGITNNSSPQTRPLPASLTVDENGNALLVTPNTPPGGFFFNGSLQADPGPGGLALALTYNLQGPTSVVAGDVLMQEVGGTAIQDIVR